MRRFSLSFLLTFLALSLTACGSSNSSGSYSDSVGTPSSEVQVIAGDAQYKGKLPAGASANAVMPTSLAADMSSAAGVDISDNLTIRAGSIKINYVDDAVVTAAKIASALASDAANISGVASGLVTNAKEDVKFEQNAVSVAKSAIETGIENILSSLSTAAATTAVDVFSGIKNITISDISADIISGIEDHTTAAALDTAIRDAVDVAISVSVSASASAATAAEISAVTTLVQSSELKDLLVALVVVDVRTDIASTADIVAADADAAARGIKTAADAADADTAVQNAAAAADAVAAIANLLDINSILSLDFNNNQTELSTVTDLTSAILLSTTFSNSDVDLFRSKEGIDFAVATKGGSALVLAQMDCSVFGYWANVVTNNADEIIDGQMGFFAHGADQDKWNNNVLPENAAFTGIAMGIAYNDSDYTLLPIGTASLQLNKASSTAGKLELVFPGYYTLSADTTVDGSGGIKGSFTSVRPAAYKTITDFALKDISNTNYSSKGISGQFYGQNAPEGVGTFSLISSPSSATTPFGTGNGNSIQGAFGVK